MRFHDLRHTHATLLLGRRLTDVKTLAARLGHSTTRVTLDIYAHRVPDLEEEAVNKLADVLFGERGR